MLFLLRNENLNKWVCHGEFRRLGVELRANFELNKSHQYLDIRRVCLVEFQKPILMFSN